MDTVFDDGAAAERPFRVEGDIARGPGVSDMKAGLLAGFFATHVLQDVGFEGFGTITYVCNPDEEIGSPYSGPIIRELAPEHDAALVLEGARANGDIVSARKGITDFTIEIAGRAAHAGVEPEKGRNAVLQAAHTILALEGLNGRWPGVTLNVGVVRGGTRSNVVAERCELQVDLRSPELATLEEAEAEVERICADIAVPDVSITIDVHGWHRPMEKGEGARRLVEIAVGARRRARVRAAGRRDRGCLGREHDELRRDADHRRPRPRRWRRPRTRRMGGPHERRPSNRVARCDHLAGVTR